MLIDVILWQAIQSGSVRDLDGPPIVGNIAVEHRLIFDQLLVQLGLGFGAYLTRVVWTKDAAQPMLSMVTATVAHVAVGALLLATSVVLAARVYRHTSPQAEAVIAHQAPNRVVA